MLVSLALEPPLMMMRPSSRLLIPGQNMSWFVFDTVLCDTAPLQPDD